MLPGSSLLCMEQQGQPQLDHESLASLLILLFVEANKICTLRFHRVIRNLCYHIPTRDWIIRTILSIIERSNIQPKQNEQQQTISNRPHWLNIRLDAALGNRNNIFIIKKKCHSVDDEMEVDDSSDEITNAMINEFSIAIHPQAAQVVCRHALDLLIALAKNFPANFLPIKKKPTNNTKPTIDENQPSTSSSARAESSQLDISTDFWDILLRLEMRSRSQKASKKSGFGRENSTNVIRTEDFTDIEVNSFSESPFGQLISMLSFNIILKSTLLTDKLLRLLAFISIGLPDAVLASTIQPVSTNAIEASTEITANNAETNNETESTETTETNADNDSTTAAATAPSGSENQTHNTARRETSTPTLTSTSTSTSTAPTTVRSSKPAPIELDERCLPESQDSLRLAIEVLTSKSCSEEGLEDATSLLLNLSQCSNVTRTFILNLLIDGAKYLAGIVQGQINDLIIDLRQLNQKNRSELNPSSSQPNVVQDIHTENVYQPSTSSSSYVSKTTSASASGSKGILKDRFTKETVVITSTSKQKARCELQLPSMVPLISKTASQSFFLRILKVVIQIRESAKDSLAKETATIQQQQQQQAAAAASGSNGAPSSTSATASTKTPTQESSKRIVLNSIELQPLSETLLLDHLWNTLSDCLVELEENADHHAVLVLQPAVEAFFLVHASNQSNSSKQSNETDSRSQNQATANPTGDNAVNPPTNEPTEAMQTDEPPTNTENNVAVTADSEMAPVSPISLFDRYALDFIRSSFFPSFFFE